jgi:hypothetical protein
MRHLVIALGVVVLAAVSAFAAQSATLNAQLQQIERGVGQAPSSVSRPAPQPPPVPAPAPPTTVPPPITYPFPPLMPAPTGGLTPRVGEGPPFRTFTPIFNPSGSPYYPPFVGGYLDMTGYDWRKIGRRAAPQPPAATGLLRLAVTPLTAQVFVDSLYAGTVEDINAQNVIQLEAGPHRIEIRAAGYQTQTFDIRIPPYETVTYRGALEATRVAPATRAPAAAAAPTSMYVIPNCYLGNIPPRPNRLPPGCDIKQLQVLAPK